MAAGFTRARLPHHVDVAVAGIEPTGRIDPLAVRVMRERRVDIAALEPHGLTNEAAEKADLVIVLQSPEEDLGALPCPDKIIPWDVEDPLGWPADIYEDVRDEIERRVETLVDWVSERAFEADAPWATVAPHVTAS